MLTAIVIASTVAIVIVINRRIESFSRSEYEDINNTNPEHQIAARVDNAVIYHEDLQIAGIDPSALKEWTEDELLADLAVDRGLENVRKSRLIQDRARQIYLRDELLGNSYMRVPFPDSAEVLHYMNSDSLIYMVERHYYQILLSNESMADSIHERLVSGDNFQITAERMSIGQKAGIGGDLGFLTAGELLSYGVPEAQALIEGLGDVVSTDYGWHIFLVDEVRPLEDTSRAVRSIADDIYRQRLKSARDSLIVIASADRDVFIDSTLLRSPDTGPDTYGNEAE